MTKLSAEAYAIVEGRHSDPFHYLGLHKQDDKSIVRAFLPEARLTLAQAERAQRTAQRAARGETGRLRVGFVDPRVVRLVRVARRPQFAGHDEEYSTKTAGQPLARSPVAVCPADVARRRKPAISASSSSL